MTDRKDMDRPATVSAAVLGVVLIAISLPFLFGSAAAGGKAYALAWSQTEAKQGDAPFAGNGQTASFALPPITGLFSNVTVTMVACSDTHPNPAEAAATISWELDKDNVSFQTGSATCRAGDVQTFTLHPHPDVASEKAASPADAESKAWATPGYHNATHVFALKFSYSRATSPASGLPGVGSTFAGRMGIKVQQWTVVANEQTGATK
jgi:hypothetical protein